MFERFTCPKCGGHSWTPTTSTTRMCNGPNEKGGCDFSWRQEDDSKYLAKLSARIDRTTDTIEAAAAEVGQAGRALNRLAGTVGSIVDQVKNKIGPATRVGKRDVPPR